MSHLQERYHSLDFLRAFAMLLGIFLHAALSFSSVPVPFWPAHDDENGVAADIFIFLVHDFRMQTFFLLAGFFSGLLYQRYHMGGMLQRRLLRIVIPFGAALLIIVPTLQALWLLGDLNAVRFVGKEVDPTTSRAELLAELFGTGRFLTDIYPFHLWFLYYLICFSLLLIPLIGLMRSKALDRAARAGDRLFRKLISMRSRALLLAALTAGLLWPSQIWGIVDTQVFWAIKPHVFGYYFLFFLSGWMLWRHRDLLSAFTRHWSLWLLLGNLLIAPIFLLSVKAVADAKLQSGEMPGTIDGIVTCYVSTLYTWLMVIGLMGAFQRFFDGHRSWVRYLADASYWCYLWHLTPIVALQLLLEHVPLFGPVKFLVIVAVSMAVLLATYEWCVRFTFIGAILNGRKQRAPRPIFGDKLIPAISLTQSDGAVVEKC